MFNTIGHGDEEMWESGRKRDLNYSDRPRRLDHNASENSCIAAKGRCNQ
jgi:hypothetical protein